MRVDRFVLDNNIWISYFITNRHDQLIDIIDLYGISIFSCDELIDEFVEVLKYRHLQKYNINIPKSVRILKEVTTPFKLKYPIKRYIPEDDKDDYIVALALQTNSGFITSGDTHILSRKEILEGRYSKLKILSKADFEAMFPLK
jgi:uncharacterized protein